VEPRDGSDIRCPLCGEGVLSGITYDRQPDDGFPKQAPESAEVLMYTCGHEVPARRLARAARDDPNVERREAGETVSPVDAEGGPS
jgi:hypothetical protein